MLHLISTGTGNMPGHLQNYSQRECSDYEKVELNMYLHAWRTSAAPTVSIWSRSSQFPLDIATTCVGHPT